MDATLDEYLRKKLEQDQAAAVDSRRETADNQFGSNLGRAFNTIGSGLSGVDLKDDFYDTLDKQNVQKVADKKTDRSLVNDYLMNKYKFGKEADRDALEQKKVSVSEKENARKAAHDSKMEEIAAQRAASYDKYTTAAAQNNANKVSNKETPGEKALSEATGKEYAQYVAQGGSASAGTHLSNIDSVINDLETGKVTTGGITGMAPDWARAKLDSSGLAAQQKITDAVMSSLRQTLGAQFTENEGKKVLGTAYDPNLPTQENVIKLKALKTKLEQMAKAKDDSMKYFEENGSMRGYKGNNYAQPTTPTQSAPSATWDDTKEKRLQELKQKLGK